MRPDCYEKITKQATDAIYFACRGRAFEVINEAMEATEVAIVTKRQPEDPLAMRIMEAVEHLQLGHALASIKSVRDEIALEHQCNMRPVAMPLEWHVNDNRI